MVIRTKIIATAGPASSSVEKIRQLAEAGCDAFRVNFSHGDNESRQALLENIRRVEAELNSPLAVIADLCGPKIRVGLITGGSVLLAEGQELVIQRKTIEGDARRISTTLEELTSQATVGEKILLDDGKIQLEVAGVQRGEEIVCKVVRGGVLASGKGLNLPDTDLKLSALTDKDRRDVKWIAQHDFDYVALSFVQRADDIIELRRLLAEAGCSAHIIAKIEKPQALNNIEAIIDVADVIMVARGDLGVEMDLPAVPVAQKRIASLCECAGKPCIIATQMLETMTHSAVPTRAEVSDVANAVMDHADAVMLSGETAVGEYPVQAVGMMNRIVQQIQSYHDETAAHQQIIYKSATTTAAIAEAVHAIIAAERIAAVAVFTASGTTARMLAKNRLPCPILAMSQNIDTVRRICLYYGVQPVQAIAPEHTRDVLALTEQYCLEKGIAGRGDKIVVVSGRPIAQAETTNTIVVHTIK